jgi:FkbH-like protein
LYYNATMQHPAELGRWVADLYLDALVAQAVLRRRKVIVCDLDNTLWNGMIGEGEIQHLPERQKILKALRDRGMLLAINSKNARESVDWEGAVLGPQDFVSTQINWLPKAQNTERIAAELNLNCRDFLFLDDQPAERAMMAQVMPEVLCVDAGSPTVWRRLALLAELLPRAGGVDRTLFYQQRSQRQLALALPEHDPQQQAAVFRKLGLEVRSRAAVKKDAPRLVELINRTNQFNLCGSRTTPAEMHRWLHSANHQVLALEAQDKFGSMGTVCVAVLERTGGCLDIVAFVLSCRVFGFGVETVLINTVKRIARSQRASAAGKSLTVRGRWVETGLNEPCRSVYADHGFALQGGLWSCQGTDPIEDPEWLTVIREPMERYAIG